MLIAEPHGTGSGESGKLDDARIAHVEFENGAVLTGTEFAKNAGWAECGHGKRVVNDAAISSEKKLGRMESKRFSSRRATIEWWFLNGTRSGSCRNLGCWSEPVRE
jgi:hypothetical protein